MRTRRSPWTVESALAAGAAFVAEERRYPTQIDSLAGDVPQWTTVRALFGSAEAYRAQLPIPQPLPPVPMRRCLKCEQWFTPEDKVFFQCNPCKQGDDYCEVDDTWLGEPVKLARAN